MMRFLSLAVACLLGSTLPSAAVAATTINFTGISSLGAGSYTMQGVDTKVYTQDLHDDDVVSGSITIDFSDLTVTRYGSGSVFTYSSSSPDFLKITFDGGRVQPITSGAMIGGVVSVFDYGNGNFEIAAQGDNTNIYEGEFFNGLLKIRQQYLSFYLKGTLASPIDPLSPNLMIATVSDGTYGAGLASFDEERRNGVLIGTTGSKTLSAGRLVIVNGIFAGAVPEPATWAMMLVGFGMVGGAARYRRRSVRVSLA